jgi:hypothetical protein
VPAAERVASSSIVIVFSIYKTIPGNTSFDQSPEVSKATSDYSDL